MNESRTYHDLPVVLDQPQLPRLVDEVLEHQRVRLAVDLLGFVRRRHEPLVPVGQVLRLLGRLHPGAVGHDGHTQFVEGELEGRGLGVLVSQPVEEQREDDERDRDADLQEGHRQVALGVYRFLDEQRLVAGQLQAQASLLNNRVDDWNLKKKKKKKKKCSVKVYTDD